MDRFEYGMTFMLAWASPMRLFVAAMLCCNPITLAVCVAPAVSALLWAAWIAPMPKVKKLKAARR